MFRWCGGTGGDVESSSGCRGCGWSRPLEVDMTTKQGRRMRMVSCPRCETRTWLTEDGSPLGSDDVYRIAAGDPEFELKPAPRKASSR